MPWFRQLSFLLCFCVLQAAQAGSGLQSLRFERLGPDQLGVQTSVVAAQQDARGLVWLGTTDGLLRYDGRAGKLFAPEPADPKTLRNAYARTLVLLPGERLLVGTDLGVDEFDLRTEVARHIEMPEPRSGRGARVLRMQAGRAGKVWVQRSSDLMLYDTESRRLDPVVLRGLQPLRAGESPTLSSVLADGQGGVWLVGGRELLHVDAERELVQRWPLGYFGGQEGVRSLVVDAAGRAWVGSNLGVRVMDTRSGEVLPLPDQLGLPRAPLHASLLDSKGTLWLGFGDAGLWRWPAGEAKMQAHRHHPALRDSLAQNSVSLLFEDRSGVIWAGHWGAGVSVVDPRSGGFRSYRSVVGDPDSLASDGLMAVQQEGASHAWVASYGQGLDRLNLVDGTAEHVPASQLPMRYLKALLLQRDRLWIGGDGGLYLMELPGRQIRRIDLHETAGPGTSIASLLADRQGRIWVASAGGIYRIEAEGQVKRYRAGKNGSLSNEVIDHLLEDREGRLWAGSKAGLQLYDPDLDAFVQPVQASSDVIKPGELPVLMLRQDLAGRLWIGSAVGLYELEPAPQNRWQLRSWRGLAGMPRGWIHSLENAPDGALWFASADGLSRLDPERRSLRHYAARRGYFAGEFAQGGSQALDDGSLLFSGAGLLRFNPSQLQDNPHPPSVVLADIRIFNRSLADKPTDLPVRSEAASSLEALGIQGPLAQAGAVRLSHHETMVSFDLRAQHFYSPRLIQYAWRLEGFDADWILGPPGEGLATYTNLDPGRYRLMAKAANPDGAWGEARQLVEVEVLPPWWRSYGFRGLLVVLLLLTPALVWQLRLRRLQMAKRELESEVGRRTAEVQAQRQQIATLSEIGRDLTASLDLERIQRALLEHVETLMPATVFGIGLVDRERRVVDFDFMIERGLAYRPYQRSLDVVEQPAARCVASGEAMLVREFAHDNRLLDEGVRGSEGERLLLSDGSEPTQARSALYVPLKVKGEVIGILSVLSDQPDAYDQTHLDMLQTLGAYAAVALDNAEAYRQLKQAQQRLAAQEKLASLGSLVAGVAHEMNTPIGNSLLAASTLRDDARRLAESASSGQLRRSDLQTFCEQAAFGTELLLRSLHAAAGLISSFKQLAVDQAAEQRRQFELAGVCVEVKLSLANRMHKGGHELLLDVPEHLELDSFPGPLGQVLSNLVLNSLIHGFDGRQGGRMRLQAEALGADRIRLRFSDDGSGIAPAHLGRVFDPFFTTRMGSGSNGLGLHLSYTIVSSLLGGQFTVSSEPGQGAVFEILLPRVAP
ncbi:ATP-binding protein [Pelomonas sp. SE-A7]|uniref:ATP-binding protein n=1 Tax=Pelomonas sp. SE-A7 TaxID=3054953 RepID=UPI00259CDCCD|nr:ATP-binding protein [Pelomonas sp. SE-A7]MDM4766024.1 ATP-binding protein [Pelomonas sp. SE-A7]